MNTMGYRFLKIIVYLKVFKKLILKSFFFMLTYFIVIYLEKTLCIERKIC